MLFCERSDRAARSSRLIYTEAHGRGGLYGYFMCLGREHGSCDLPHLPVAAVEEAIVAHYRTLDLPAGFAATIEAQIGDFRDRSARPA